ncbi:MAG: DUF6513 domain-containing protein, partial [Nitrospinota bacterium]|nr:DUF6513 domain-containing protein [Nitrospinota bacterium]
NPAFDCHVIALPAKVAALMSAEYIARKLPAGLSGSIMIPGGCKGPLGLIRKAASLKVQAGPVDLLDLPAHFGGRLSSPGYAPPRLRILAEIVDAPALSMRQIIKRAEYYAVQGADIIDIGCMNQTSFPHLADAVRELKARGYRVSVDTADPAELAVAGEAGAEMFLSVNSANLDVASRLPGKVVLIPDPGRGMGSFFRNAEKLSGMGVDLVLDPILDPLMMGAAKSLARYVEVARKFPKAQVMMGAGNLTELAEADNLGLNAMIAGLCAELGVEFVLTTEAAPWNAGAVAQLALARNIMEYAGARNILPRGFDHRLVALRDGKAKGFSPRQVAAIRKGVADRNYRIFVSGGKIHIFNKDIYFKASGVDGIMEKLDMKDPAHAFYLGMELMKAQTALELGKNYVQDNPLSWGYMSKKRRTD